MRTFAVNLTIFVFVSLLGVAAMEIGIRVLFPIYDPSGQVTFAKSTPDGPTLGAPNTSLRQTKLAGDYDVVVTFNSYGFRDHHNLASGNADDLYVVGDSFSFGWGVDAAGRYSNVLEQLSGTRTFNISIPGDFDEYARLLRYAKEQGADIRNIIVGVCMENDLHLYGAAPAEPKPVEEPVTRGPSLSFVKEQLTNHSALYKMAASLVHRMPAARAAAVRFGLIADIEKSAPSEAFDPAVIAASVEKLQNVIAPYRATLLIIPSRALWIGDAKVAAARYHDSFTAALRERGDTVVDMRARFEASGDPMQYHFKNDGHWTAEAHALAAKAIYESLEKTSQ